MFKVGAGSNHLKHEEHKSIRHITEKNTLNSECVLNKEIRSTGGVCCHKELRKASYILCSIFFSTIVPNHCLESGGSAS